MTVNIKRRRKPVEKRQREGEPPAKKLAIREEVSESEKYDWETSVKCLACQEGGKVLEEGKEKVRLSLE